MITNHDAEPIQPSNRGQVDPTQPVQPIDAAEAERFANLKKQAEMKEGEASEVEDGMISPEELQRQIRENLFKNGFNKAMEKAREISKELKEG
ncbi:hypothetical protein [Endozoicomonas sp. 8E]|uniref:hypothetical protein n=1 Tax=Endozoicomonas sp. 8E TaxID=3035692 RepID=UPI00293912B1|nr:hypothetical protein [Endozoicomonas sp. 8E]WOG29330.1 hypothetical protein P6910_06665 [Endozoicomonas sp. 8E]